MTPSERVPAVAASVGLIRRSLSGFLAASALCSGGTILDFATGTDGFVPVDSNGTVVRADPPGSGSLRMTNPPNWHWRGRGTFTISPEGTGSNSLFANELAAAGRDGGTLRFDLILGKNNAIAGRTGSFWGVQYHLAINQAGNGLNGWFQQTFLQLAAGRYPPSEAFEVHPVSVRLRPWSETTDEIRINPDSPWYQIHFGSNFGGATTAEWHVDNLRVVPDAPSGNRPPSFASGVITRPAAAAERSLAAASLSGSASDPDAGDTLVFSKVSGPSWLTVSADGALGGTPARLDIGMNLFGVRVADAAGLAAEAILRIEVIDPDAAPALLLEAEAATLTGVVIASTVPGFSGTGYVTGFDHANDKVGWTFDAAGGVYRLKIHYRSPFGNKGFSGRLNDAGLSGTFIASTGFAVHDAYLVELRNGMNTLEIGGGWSYYEIDAVTLVAEQPAPPMAVPGLPCNPLASAAAIKLLGRLCADYGKVTFSGQHGVADAHYIQNLTGKLPCIIEGDLMNYSPSRVARQGVPEGYTESILSKQLDGHLIGFAWHWNAPEGLMDSTAYPWWRGFYTAGTTFNLTDALAAPAGEGHQLLLRDIDAIAVELRKAASANIPILWRPLHESEGGWFWWGAHGPEAFKQLWRLLYERLTSYHGIHNLIWVLASEDPDWYPGDDVVDVIGVDAYPENRADALSSRWMALLARFDGLKPLALTEFGGVPDIERMRRLGVSWAWFASWTGNEGAPSEPDEKVIRIYQSPDVLTLDELGPPNRLPGFLENPLPDSVARAGVRFVSSLAPYAADPDAGGLLAFEKTGGPSWLVVTSDGLLGGTPAIADAGANDFTFRVTDADGRFAEADLRIMVGLSPYQSWAADEFGHDAADTAVADPLTATGDAGRVNLLNYAFGQPPPGSGDAAGLWPVAAIGTDGHLILTIPKNPAATDVLIVAEATGNPQDPASWMAAEAEMVASTPEMLIFRDAKGGRARFMRVRVSLVPP